MLALVNVNILTPATTVYSGAVVVEAGRLAAAGRAAEVTIPPGAQVIDGRGGRLVPGFIDLQVNGALGHDFTTAPAGIWPAAAWLPATGVTAFLATLVSAPPDSLEAAQDAWLAGPPKGFVGAIPLGLHLEGPYLNPAKRGAHGRAHLRLPRLDDVVHWSPATGVRMVTLAPELEGADWLADLLAERGILVAAGHSLADFDQARRGFTAGIRYATHLFNAMPALHHRQPGLAGAALADERITLGLIADGRHVHPALVKVIWQVARDGRLNLISDAMAALGLGPGEYRLGGASVQVADGAASLDGGVLAGSVLSLDAAVRNLIRFTGCSLNEALATVTATPARLLGLGDRKGQIRPGYDADLVLLDDHLRVQMTLVAGEVIFTASA